MLPDLPKWTCPLPTCKQVVCGGGDASLKLFVTRHITRHHLQGDKVEAPGIVAPGELDSAILFAEKLYGRLNLTAYDKQFLHDMRISPA